MTRERLLATALLELADTIAEDVDAFDLLQTLASRTADLLSAYAAAVLLADQRGRLQLVASSSHDADVLSLEVLAARQGPCLDAFEEGRPLFNLAADEAERRWPDYVTFAARRGVSSSHALPLRVRTGVLGVVAVFFLDAGELSEEDQRIAEALGNVATIGLLQERTERQRELIAEQLQTVLGQRVVLEQAKGIIAEYFQCSIDEAFLRMRHHADLTGTSLSRVARAVVDRSIGREELRRQIF